MDRPFIAQQFGNWCAAVEYGALPDNVRRIAERAILDTVGVIAAGGRHRLVTRILQTMEGESGPSMAVGGKLANPQAAALVNGTAAHVYDFDDTSYTGIMHGSAVILPAILAVAGEIACSRESLMTAFVAGSEIAYTLADSLTHSHYFKGWWSTGTLGLVGATAAVSRLYGLDGEKTASAIGLAASGASGTKAIVGTDGKAFFVGEAARRAVDFAKAAAVGIRGPHDAIESHCGFVPLLNSGTIELHQINTLGERWRLTDPGLLFKLYPVCSAAHALIEQTASLVEEAQCDEGDVDAVICEIPELVDISLVFDMPTSVQQAQFSLPFVVACALHHGAVRLEDLKPETVTRPEIRALMARVEKKVDPRVSTDEQRKKHPESAGVTLVLNDGRTFSGFCGEAYGMPNRPLSDEDLVAKFRGCLRFAGRGPDFAAKSANELLSSNEQFSSRSFTDIMNGIWQLPDVGATDVDKRKYAYRHDHQSIHTEEKRT